MKTQTVPARRATPRATAANASDPQPTTSNPLPTTTTAKARYALMRQALEAARKPPPGDAAGENRLLDFLKS